MNPWLLLLLGWLGMALVMIGVWLVQRRLGDAGWVDFAWAAGVGGLSVLFAVFSSGAPPRRVLVGVLAGLWGLRLSFYLIRRLFRLPEDGRYVKLRQQWGDQAQRNLFLFFQVQAFWAVLFAVPMLVASQNDAPELGLLDALGVVVWLIAVIGETIADRQLANFRQNPANRGQVCRAGLWYYSRHPNYFFEWVHWWAYVAIGISGPHGWLTLFGPALMLFFLLKVTGIPPTEAHALASRGDAYRDYQRTTSVFFPWPPRKLEKV